MVKTIAISGSGGFIGRALKLHMEGLGNKVVRIPRPLLLAPARLRHLFSEVNPDVIIHAASYGNHYHHYFTHDVIDANISAAYYLMQEAAHNNARFIYFSSSSVKPNMRTTLYSASKIAGEEILKAFINQYNMHGMIIRPGTVTGPGEQDHRLIPTLIRSCMQGVAMPFVGYPVHDYVDVRDLCKAVQSVIISGARGQVYEVGGRRSYSNEEVKDMVEVATGKTAVLERVESMRSYDTKHWTVDNHAIQALGWRADYHLIDSIEDMVKDEKRL